MQKLLIVLALATACSAAHLFKNNAPSCVRSGTCTWGDWRAGARVVGDEMLTMRFAVKNKNMDTIEALISGPRPARWMTRDEVRALTLDTEAIETVNAYMQKAGFVDIELHGAGFIEGRIEARIAEKLFNTQFINFYSKSTGRTIQRALGYSLSTEIASLLDFVEGTVQFPQTLRAGSILRESAIAQNLTTPAVLNSYYSIDSNTVADTKSTQSLFESLGQSYSPDDLKSFEKTYNIPTQDCVEVIGPNTPADCKKDTNNCAEANLDVQYMIAVAQGAPTTYWSIAHYILSDPFLEWALAVEDDTNPPYVHSISYGGDESANDHDSEFRMDQEVAKLNARGLTVMVSSGDDGVAGSGARSSSANCGFNPTYPGQLPHIISVGATMGPEYGGTEVACTSNAGGVITTGGGFSNLFSAPDWQSSYTAAFIKKTNVPTTKFNTTGRGYPDVGMAGHNYPVVIGGRTYELSGTSASSPVFGALVTLANGMRIAQGKATLGQLNQDLYKIYAAHPEAFNDVKAGENNCAAQGTLKTICCQYGFTCIAGWDPATGLGSVNFDKLAPLLVAL